MSPVDADYVDRRKRLAAFLAGSEWFKGETKDGDPRAYATAHSILEIEESCRNIVDLIAGMEKGDGLSPEDFASNVREELRHVHWHIADDESCRSSSKPPAPPALPRR